MIDTLAPIESAEEAIRVLGRLARYPAIGLDCETFGHPELTTRHYREWKRDDDGEPIDGSALDVLTCTPRLLQVSTEDEVHLIDLVRSGLSLKALQDVLVVDGRWLVIQNSRFELGLMLTAGVDISEVRIWDTALASQVLHAGQGLKHKLEQIVERELGFTMDKEQQTSDWSGDLTTEQLRYAAKDAEVMLPLRNTLRQKLIEAKLDKVAAMEFRAAPAIATMQWLGLPIDREGWSEIAQEAAKVAETKQAALNEMVGPIPEEALPATKDERRAASGRHSQKTPEEKAAMLAVYREAQTTMFDALDVHRVVYPNWGSWQQVQAAFARRGIEIPSTGEKVLSEFAHKDPAIELLLDYREAAKMAGTYGEKLLSDHVHPLDGRIHPSWNQIGAESSGRMSSSSPNFQNIPSRSDWAKRYRKCIRAPEGRSLVKCVAPWTRLLGADLHWYRADSIQVGQEVVGFDEELGRDCKWRSSFVTAVSRSAKPCYRVITDRGIVTCSAEHRWVVTDAPARPRRWRETQGLKPGQRISFLGRFRPRRLMEKQRLLWEGRRAHGRNNTPARILAVFPVGDQEVVSIATTTGTFVAEGLMSHNCDFSQIELRIAAEMAKDRTLIEAYNEERDMHTMTAERIFGRSLADMSKDEAKRARAIGKTANFALLYGQGADSFLIYTRTNAKITLTPAEAKRYRQAFFDAYPGLKRWHARTPSDEVIATRTLLGRRRLGVKNFTQKLNTPVQGTGGDMLKMAIGDLWRDRAAYPDANLIMAIHDELVYECPTEQAEEVGAWVQTTMEAAGQRFLKLVPCKTGDPEIGPSWGGD